MFPLVVTSQHRKFAAIKPVWVLRELGMFAYETDTKEGPAVLRLNVAEGGRALGLNKGFWMFKYSLGRAGVPEGSIKSAVCADAQSSTSFCLNMW